MLAEAVVNLLSKAGFVDIVVDHKLGDIQWAAGAQNAGSERAGADGEGVVCDLCA